MEGSPRIEKHDEVSSVRIDGKPISTPRTSSSLHAQFKQPGLAKETALKKVKVEPEGDPARKLHLSPDEEKALISTMKDLVLEGWKAGQGWKRGTYPKAAKMVKSLVPGSRISAKDVENRLHNWGKQYRLLHEFLRLKCEEQWRELQKSNSRYAKLRGKTFPHYALWYELFGQHRATGSSGGEGRMRSVPSEVFKIRDEPDEEDVQESEPTHNSHIEQSPVTEVSKKERLDCLADVVEEHMELGVANRFRLIKHLMANDSGYLYFICLDHATRKEYIRAFLDGQVD